jgi:hypothetical protein
MACYLRLMKNFLLIASLLFTLVACNRNGEDLGNLPDGPDAYLSQAQNITPTPGSELAKICNGMVAEGNGSQATNSRIFVLRYRLNMPEGCAIYLDQSRYQRWGKEGLQFWENVTPYYKLFFTDPDSTNPHCVPQGSVWMRTDYYNQDHRYYETFVRLDVPEGADQETIKLYSFPNEFPKDHFGFRPASCQ